MTENIFRALNNPCNSSEQFLAITHEIATNVSLKFNCYYEICIWGNYTYCNIISLFFNNNKHCESKPEAFDRKIQILISARGPFYVFGHYLCSRDQKGKITSYPVTTNNLPVEILESIKAITTILEKYNMQLIDDKQLLAQMADGHYTELDGVPASVFEVLFGEII